MFNVADLDPRYVEPNWLYVGFPGGRTPAGDLATAAIRMCVGSKNIKFDRISKDTARSYWCDEFNEFNIRHCMRVLNKLGFAVEGHCSRQIGCALYQLGGDEEYSGEMSKWKLHVHLRDAAIKQADLWKNKAVDLDEIVNECA